MNNGQLINNTQLIINNAQWVIKNYFLPLRPQKIPDTKNGIKSSL